MSGADIYGPCPSCGVNVDPWEHDCPEVALEADRQAWNVAHHEPTD